jgi:nucleoside-diphosphate-sugar epimerase
MESVCVTGATGFIAGHIITQLLESKTYKVHATVRSLQNKEKNKHLLELVESSDGRLELFEADLSKPDSFDAAVAGCMYVLHTASPFVVEGVKDAQKELVDPAVQGTQNVLSAVNKAESVRRVVVTSSCAAIYDSNDDRGAGHVFTEADWNTASSLTLNPYSFSKVSAERKAWEMQKEQSRWTLATINPSFVVGPGSSKRTDSTSMGFMVNLLNGRMATGVPDVTFGYVDVRDVAQAHILAMTKEGAAGQRYLCSNDVLSWKAFSDLLKPEFNAYPLAGMVLPKPLVYVVGPLFSTVLTWAFISHNVGINLNLDASKIQQELGLKFRPVKQTAIDAATFCVEQGLVKKR